MQREAAPAFNPPPRGTWRDSVLQPNPPHRRSPEPAAVAVATPPPPQPRPRRRGMVVTHCLDLLLLVFLAALAAVLRFGDLYLIRPQLKGIGGLCLSLAYRVPRQLSSIELPHYAVYILAILAPLVLLGLLEVVLALTGRKDRTKSIWTVAFFKRAAKLKLLFLLGLCLTSAVADLIRLLASRPRPYFLADNEYGYGFARYCSDAEDENIGSEERDARLSFPSHRCTMLAFCGVVVAVHADRVLRRVRAGGVYSLRALSAFLCAVPALLVAAQTYHSRANHWEDVVVGLLLGAATATYVVRVLSRELAKDMEASTATPPAGAFPEVAKQNHHWKGNNGRSRNKDESYY